MLASLRSFSPAAFLAAFLFAAALPLRAQSTPAPAASSDAPKAYSLNLSPAFKVGQKFGLSSSLTTDTNMTITVSAPTLPAPQVQHQRLFNLVNFVADCEVLAVNKEGQPQKLAVTVKTLQAMQNGQPIAGLPAVGKVIIAEETDKNEKSLTVDGTPLSPEITKLLQDSFPVQPDGKSDQIMFGPKDPVAVGATWSPSPDLLANLKENMPSATGVNGKMKLDGVEGSGDSQVAKVSATLTVVGATAPLPPPMNAIPAECTVQLSGSFPAVAKGTFNQSMKMDMKFAGETDASTAHLKVDATATQDGSQTITIP